MEINLMELTLPQKIAQAIVLRNEPVAVVEVIGLYVGNRDPRLYAAAERLLVFRRGIELPSEPPEAPEGAKKNVRRQARLDHEAWLRECIKILTSHDGWDLVTADYQSAVSIVAIQFAQECEESRRNAPDRGPAEHHPGFRSDISYD